VNDLRAFAQMHARKVVFAVVSISASPPLVGQINQFFFLMLLLSFYFFFKNFLKRNAIGRGGKQMILINAL
jgi:hypothetical protein